LRLLLEQLAARAWPAAEAVAADGWLLRHTPTLTRRRSNSALPVGDAPDAGVVEEFYARRGRPALVQIAPAEVRSGLDQELARRGWTSEGPTDILTANAATVLARTERGVVAIAPALDASWVAVWAACEGRADAEAHADGVLARIEPATAYAIAADGAGVGLAVCERGWAGLFCVATAPHARRRGVAHAVVHALARWAAERGAQQIYLQVEADNAAAHSLYAGVGFSRSHGYHYRVAPTAQLSPSLRSAWSTSARTLLPAISRARSCWISR
jgi:GNAT superfamily N-acetyltransferase